MFEQIMSVATRNALSNLSETSQVSVGGGASSIAPVGPAPTASFGDVLAQMTGSVSNKLAGAEANSIQSMTGDVAVRDVVNSVMEAEQSLQTAIAIRDKIVQAYLEISRMPI